MNPSEMTVKTFMKMIPDIKSWNCSSCYTVVNVKKIIMIIIKMIL